MASEDPEWLTRAREHWVNRGRRRPDFAEEPGPGEESVWDYPRPPIARPCARPVRVLLAGVLVAESRNAIEVLETAHPPTVYFPPGDVDGACLKPAQGSSFCEWKGSARYFDVCAAGMVRSRAAWSYPDPFADFRALADYLCFYPSQFRCFYGDAPVQPQAGGFYGGWVRPGLVGPFKGEPGTGGW